MNSIFNRRSHFAFLSDGVTKGTSRHFRFWQETKIWGIHRVGISSASHSETNQQLFSQISNNGEFVDNIYREQDPSKIVGRLIGRNQVQTNAKKVYTTADIVCETYLHKKGSWMQNWKRRYFVLRKDIRSICYYDNRENLTLLGSIPLDSETVITPVPPKDASKCIFFVIWLHYCLPSTRTVLRGRLCTKFDISLSFFFLLFTTCRWIWALHQHASSWRRRRSCHQHTHQVMLFC